jgi:hypothetical protein
MTFRQCGAPDLSSHEFRLLAKYGLKSAALFYWNLNKLLMRRADRAESRWTPLSS